MKGSTSETWDWAEATVAARRVKASRMARGSWRGWGVVCRMGDLLWPREYEESAETNVPRGDGWKLLLVAGAGLEG